MSRTGWRTSRTEYRLIQRQDNADERLTPVGYRIGLVSEERYQAVLAKYQAVREEIARLEHCGAAPSPELDEMLERRGEPPARHGVKLSDLLRRPRVTYADLAPFDPERPELNRLVTEQVEIQLKYKGYIDRQMRQVEEFPAHGGPRAACRSGLRSFNGAASGGPGKAQGHSPV